MIQNISLPFVEATRSVFQMMLDLHDATDSSVESFPADALNIAIGVVGDLQGDVIYRFPPAAALGMVTAMCGMEVGAVDDFVTSAVSEIANIISGSVLTNLSEGGLVCDITPPEIRDFTEKSYVLSADCTVGELGISIRLNPAK